MKAFPAIPPIRRTAALGDVSLSPLLVDLLAYYRFNGNGNDSSGNGRHLTVSSGTMLGVGKVNGYLYSGDALASGLGMSTTGELTFSAWVNIDEDVGDTSAAFQIELFDELAETFFVLQVSSRNGFDSECQLRINGVGGQIMTTNTIQFTSNSQFVHVAGVLGSDGVATLYVNGISVTGAYTLVPLVIDSLRLRTFVEYSSLAGDLGIWNRALSESEILQLYNDGNGYDPTGNSYADGIVAYYAFDEGVAEVDSSGNGNDITIYSGDVSTPGKIGKCFGEGNADGNYPAIFNGEATIAFWINLGADVGDAAVAALVNVQNNSGQYIACNVISRSGSDSLVNLEMSDLVNLFTLSVPITGYVTSDEQWMLVVVTFSDLIRVYVDDFTMNDAIWTPFNLTANQVAIQSSIDYISKIAELGIWNRCLSDTERVRLFNRGGGFRPFGTDPIQTGVVGYYKFLGDGRDSSGNDNTLTINSGSLIQGKINGALSSGIASTNSLPAINTTNGITVSCWVNIPNESLESLPAGFVQIYNDDSGANPTHYLRLWWSTRYFGEVLIQLDYTFEDQGTSGDNQNSIPDVFEDTNWVNIILRLATGGYTEVFVNGINSMALNVSITLTNDFTRLIVSSSEDYSSNVGDVGIWNRLLNDEEIRRIFNKGNGFSPYR